MWLSEEVLEESSETLDALIDLQLMTATQYKIKVQLDAVAKIIKNLEKN